MKFTLSTKPLVAAANLVIINSNINEFDDKSYMLEITADRTNLYLNTETHFIVSEVKLLGTGTEEEPARAFVDALIFKNLISTLKSAQVEIDFTPNSIVVTSGKSSFSLPMLANAKDGAFRSPLELSSEKISAADNIDLGKWKYIKKHQLYAKATSYALPVYTYVWVGKDNDVLVGDLNNNLFTHSKAGQLDMDCLINDSIVNLIITLPENTKIIREDNAYMLYIMADSYEYRSQITPTLESDENGEYNAETIISIMELGDNTVKVDGAEILTAINQATLLNKAADAQLTFSVTADGLLIKNPYINAVIPIEGNVGYPYTLRFTPSVLKSFISNCPDMNLELCPRVNDGEVAGIIVHTKDYTAVVGGDDD